MLKTVENDKARRSQLLGPFTDGSFLAVSRSGFGEGYIARDTMTLERIDAQGRVENTIGSFPGTERFADFSRGFSVFLVPFGKRSSVSTWPSRDLIAVATSDSALVRILGPDGSEVTRLSLPYEETNVTDEMMESWAEENPAAARAVEDEELPLTVPPYSSVAFDAEGFLWVQQFPALSDGHSVYLVARLDGTVVEELRFDQEARLLFADRSRVVLRITDDLDVQRIGVLDRECM